MIPGGVRRVVRDFRPAVPQGKIWVGFAALTFCFFTVDNFLSGAIGQEAAKPSQALASNFQVQALVTGIAGLGVWAVLALRGPGLRTRTRFLAMAQLASGIALALAHLAIAYGITLDGVNMAIILAVLPANAVILAVACWALRGEPITVPQCVSMIVLVIGLLIMALEDSVKDGAMGIGFGLFTAVCYAAGSFGIKDGSLRGVHHISSVCLLWLGIGLTGVVVFVIATAICGRPFDGLAEVQIKERVMSSGLLYLFSVASGLAQAVAVGSMAFALVLGGAAPAMAIVTSHLSGVLLLDALLFGSGITPVQIGGFCLCIAGVLALSLLPSSTQRVPRGGVKASPSPSPAAPLDETSLHTSLQRMLTASQSSQSFEGASS